MQSTLQQLAQLVKEESNDAKLGEIMRAFFSDPARASDLKILETFYDYDFFVRSMKKYPERHAIYYPTLGMMGECGEISEKVKKWLRGDAELDKPGLLKELGDPLWYIASLADDLGYTLQDVVNANQEKLESRKARNVLKGSGDDR